MIEGRVAKILNDRELVINRGKLHGVRKGMRFDVLSDDGELILDPDTNEELGTLPRVKLSVEVTQVQEKLSVAATFRRFETAGGALYPALGGTIAAMLAPPRRTWEEISTDETTWDDLSDAELAIHTGDAVRESPPLPD